MIIRIRVISSSGLYWSKKGWTKSKKEAVVFTNYKDAHDCMNSRSDPYARCETKRVRQKKVTDSTVLGQGLAALIALGQTGKQAMNMLNRAEASGKTFATVQDLINWCYKK